MKTNNRVERNSSVEVFRIVATFLVLILHFNGWFVGMASTFDWNNISSFTIGQAFIESLSCVCVNCFLVISGFYGIKFKYRSVWNIFILLLFIYVPFCIVSMVYTGDFSLKSLLLSFFALSRESYFVQCYLMLCFLSPILNSFIERYDRSVVKYVFVFWFIEFYFDWMRGNKSLGFENGYSVIHFVLMYMLGRTAFLYKNTILKINKKWWLWGYLLNTIIIFILYLSGVRGCFAYSNPFVVISSFCLFFPFLYSEFHNKTLNLIASSTFAVYIMHVNGPFYGLLVRIDNLLLHNYSYGMYLLLVSLVIVAVFFFCVAYDRFRIFTTGWLTDRSFQFLQQKVLKSETII